jgi:hypothetical protein
MKPLRILKLFSPQGSVRCHFSQYGEDVILHKLFGKKFSNGFYIDVGAHHPFRQSNTAYLWLMGWKGVNVDASKKAISVFNSVRPQDINHWAAVVDDETYSKQSEILLYSNLELDLGATCNQELAKERQTTRSEIVPCISLMEIISRYAPLNDNRIDFLNIDIEGFDQAAIQSIGEWVTKPRVVCMEIFGENLRSVINSPGCILLEEHGYDLIERVGCSAIFKLHEV